MIDQTQEQNIQPMETVPNVQVAPPQTSVAPPPVESPTVAISGEGGGVPKWFYLVFGITLIIFFVVTTLLVLSLTKKGAPSTPVPLPQVQPTEVPTIFIPPPTLTPFPTPDELSALEGELNSLNITDLDADLTTFDSEVNNL